MKKVWLCAVLFFGVGLSACSSAEEQHAHEGENKEQPHDAMMLGDIRQETSGIDSPPDFLAGKPEDMQLLYLAVAQHQELLEGMPCYCGCGESVGHKDNYDCFIHDNKEDGAIVWDDHGTKCNVCLEIAAKSIVDYSNGKTAKEIRTEIDELYKEGYAEPTQTKMPS